MGRDPILPSYPEWPTTYDGLLAYAEEVRRTRQLDSYPGPAYREIGRRALGLESVSNDQEIPESLVPENVARKSRIGVAAFRAGLERLGPERLEQNQQALIELLGHPGGTAQQYGSNELGSGEQAP